LPWSRKYPARPLDAYIEAAAFQPLALNLVDQGNPAAQVASILGIGGSCLRQWMDPEAPDGGAGQCCDASLSSGSAANSC
jgi:hypothetical protein